LIEPQLTKPEIVTLPWAVTDIATHHR
jgi:hypothetical protein